MRIVLLASASSIHTVRWANGLNRIGLDVHVISQHPLAAPMDQGVSIHLLPYRGILGYFLIVPAVRKLVADIKPNLVNAHYASGYGTTAKLVNCNPWLLSVWGSDVYDFPYKSIIHKYLIKSNLRSASSIASTSYCMAKQTASLLDEFKKIHITPFGVDVAQFKKHSDELIESDKAYITIGTVKTMSDKYGIDTLIQAFSLVVNNLKESHPNVANRLRLRLVGGGNKIEELKLLAKQQGVELLIDFIGQVEHTKVIDELLKLDVYVALSRLDSESFGVAIIEACAAGKPVIVSNVGGLPEVVLDGVTGFVVPKENPKAAAIKIEELVLDEDLRLQIGTAGQLHVKDTYDWDICLSNMRSVYDDIIKNFNRGEK